MTMSPTLSARELEVIALVANGRSNKEIGRTLGLDADTIKSHLSRISRKIGASDRAEIVASQLRAGSITFDLRNRVVVASGPVLPPNLTYQRPTPFISAKRGQSGLEAAAEALTRAGSPPAVWRRVQAILGVTLPAVEVAS